MKKNQKVKTKKTKNNLQHKRAGRQINRKSISGRIFNKQRMLILALVLLIVIAVTIKIFISYLIIGSSKIRMDVAVSNKLGFDLGGDALHFGSVPPGNCASRGLFVENTGKQEAEAIVVLSGRMADWVEPSNKTMILQPSQPVQVSFYACIPQQTPEGNYTGEITVVLKKI